VVRAVEALVVGEAALAAGRVEGARQPKVEQPKVEQPKVEQPRAEQRQVDHRAPPDPAAAAPHSGILT
jgi:hypothetical protein